MSDIRLLHPLVDTGGALLAFAASIPAENLEGIPRVVEEDCGKIGEEGW